MARLSAFPHSKARTRHQAENTCPDWSFEKHGTGRFAYSRSKKAPLRREADMNNRLIRKSGLMADFSWVGECPWTGTLCAGNIDGRFAILPQKASDAIESKVQKDGQAITV